MTNFSILINLGLTSLGIFLKTFIVHRFWSRIPKLYFVCREGSSLSHYLARTVSVVIFSLSSLSSPSLSLEEKSSEMRNRQLRALRTKWLWRNGRKYLKWVKIKIYTTIFVPACSLLYMVRVLSISINSKSK